jgi:hypothetical protein
MGAVVKRRDFPAIIKQTRQSVFVLAPKVTVPVAAPVVNVGLLLSERIMKAKAEKVPVNITHELDAILGEEYCDIILENTNILFSPEYGVDVIKLLLQLGRNQRFYLPWPGKIDGERLTYSEPGRFDYKEYNIKDYVDTYVILR